MTKLWLQDISTCRMIASLKKRKYEAGRSSYSDLSRSIPVDPVKGLDGRDHE